VTLFPDPSSLGVFVLAAIVLLVTPGPAVLYIVARSVDQGRRAGLVSTLGIHVGTLVHIAAAAAGLSALVVASATAFGVVKYLGAAYLVYLGVRRLVERRPVPGLPGATPEPLSRIFLQGVVVNVLNPKTALFFLAFLPQFVDVGRGAVAAQIVGLGLLFVALALVSDGLYAVGAGTARAWLRRSPRLLAGERYVAGSVYIGLGLAAALSGGHRK
jgi:threonine/homoserine/homoserine lactone efflux protein